MADYWSHFRLLQGSASLWRLRCGLSPANVRMNFSFPETIDSLCYVTLQMYLQTVVAAVIAQCIHESWRTYLFI